MTAPYIVALCKVDAIVSHRIMLMLSKTMLGHVILDCTATVYDLVSKGYEKSQHYYEPHPAL